NWQGWEHFTGVTKRSKEPRKPLKKKYIANIEAPYSNLDEAQKATQRLSIYTPKEYRELYKADPRLPSAPDVKYKSDWITWSHFLRNELPLHVPAHSDHPFRFNPITDFGLIRSPISELSDQK
ncbi:MAG: integrase repeat-containing protein, partial [Pseudomonadota bacterium]|nr:integrase repeat-containing protein [Pseudomonadota bacterium]